MSEPITWYGFDSQNVFTAPIRFDPYGPVPPQSTAVAPPTVTGAKVAQWQGEQWVVLNARPAPLPAPAPVPPILIWTRFDFYKLFTQAERIAIDGAVTTKPTVKDFWRMVEAAATLQSNDADLVAGLADLTSKGLINAGRADQILSGARPA